MTPLAATTCSFITGGKWFFTMVVEVMYMTCIKKVNIINKIVIRVFNKELRVELVLLDSGSKTSDVCPFKEIALKKSKYLTSISHLLCLSDVPSISSMILGSLKDIKLFNLLQHESG